MISLVTITKVRDKCKSFFKNLFVSRENPTTGEENILAGRRIPRDVFIIAILILASSASFGLGYLAGLDAVIPIEGQGRVTMPDADTVRATSTEGQVVASKNGTKYYFASCAGVGRISDANKVWFASVSLAEAAGYTLAANCKGP